MSASTTAAAAAPAVPTPEALIAALPGMRSNSKLYELSTTYYETPLTANVLKSLLALNDTHSGMLFNALETVMVTTVGSLLLVADDILSDFTLRTNPVLPTNLPPIVIRSLADLRDKVKGELANLARLPSPFS